jgi:signal transduction histidine kinase/FixJ family two-component response regulator
MMLALGVSGILILAAAICWYAVRRPPHAARLGAAEPPHHTPPAATAVPAEGGAGASADIPEDTDETENSGGRDRKPAGKLSLLGDLAAGIAHEINNPVAIMLEEAGWIQDLLEEEEFRQSENLEEFKRALMQIKTQGARCKAIIQNLVSFGQKTSLKVGEVRVNDLVAEVVRAYDKRLRAGDVKIDTRFAEFLPDCRLSSSEMQQVLTNLINNGLDAADPEGGRVEIRTRCDGPDVVIDVSDNGPGIPKAHLDKIFDPFFTTKPVGKGTGLGLSICYGLVEKMGGNINVESEPGMGTTFHVRIPWRKHEERPRSTSGPVAEEGPEQESAPTAMVSAPTVVVLVDDEVPFVEALGRRLAKRGMEILTAFSGEEALRELERKRDVDIVLLGVNMPGMGGMETLREIKTSRPLVEVILLSADTAVESAIEGIKLGAFDYLLKPCDMGPLLDHIEKARRRKRRQEQKIMEVRIKEITSRRI